MEERAQNAGPTREPDENHGLSETVLIVCDTRQRLGNHPPDRQGGVLRKLADGILDFLGYHSANEPWRNRLRD